MMLEEIILSGFVSKVISDCVDISRDRIRKANYKRKEKTESFEARIYQIIVDVINKVTSNKFKDQEIVFDVAEAILKGFKEGKSDNKDIIKSGLSIFPLNIDDNESELFLRLLFYEISMDVNFDVYKEILLLLITQKPQYDYEILKHLQLILSDVNEVLDKINSINDSKNVIIAKSKNFENNKKQDYIDIWNSKLFLHRDNDKQPLTLADVFIMPDYVGDKILGGILRSDRLEQIIDNFVNYNRTSEMLLKGVPGIGKTSIVSWMANEYKDDDRILILRFRDWDSEELERGLLKAICNTFNCTSKYDLEYKILILDGFDEMKSLNIRDELLYTFLNDIKDFKNFKCIITSRPTYIDDKCFSNIIELQEFNYNKIEKFFEKISGKSLKIKEVSESELEILGIPVILYMAIMSGVDINEAHTKPELYNRVFAKQGGIFDKFSYEGTQYDVGNHILRDPRNIKKYLEFLQEVAFKMFEINDLSLHETEYQIPELKFQRKSVSVLEFPIKHLFESTQNYIEFIHKTIYEYFVSEYIFASLQNLSTLKNMKEEECAGVLGRMLVKNDLSKEILEFLKYKIIKEDDDIFSIICEAFKLMLKDGMIYHTKERYRKIIRCEIRIFFNMLELIHIWDKQDLQFELLVAKYIEDSIIGNEFAKVNLERVNLSMINLVGVKLNGIKLSCANLCKANLKEINLEGADLRGAKLEKATLSKAILIKANLEGANLMDAVLINANLFRSNLKRTNLIHAKLGMAYLERADLEGSNLTGANLMNANLSYANLRKVKLEGANLMDAEIKGADLSDANLKNAIVSERQITYLEKWYDLKDISHIKNLDSTFYTAE